MGLHCSARCATTIHKDSAAYKVSSSNLILEVVACWTSCLKRRQSDRVVCVCVCVCVCAVCVCVCVCVVHTIFRLKNEPERGGGEKERETERQRETDIEIETQIEQLFHSKKVRGDLFFKLACCYNSEA